MDSIFFLLIEPETKEAASPQNEAGFLFTQCSAEIINEMNHKKLTVRDMLESKWMSLSGSILTLTFVAGRE